MFTSAVLICSLAGGLSPSLGDESSPDSLAIPLRGEDCLPCDTWVALADATANGQVILAKNSDRLLFSCQPLLLHPREEWPEGAVLDLGRIEIPQVDVTFATLGSSPYWCWGYEEGINEHGVAIGNEGLRTRDLADHLAAEQAGRAPSLGPTGMDLLRLGLERGSTAREALDVITSLLEKYGQFGSGLPALPVSAGAYDNSFIIADPVEAWVLETSGRNWVAKQFTSGTTSISNTPTIADLFDLASDDLVPHALDKGWWPEQSADEFNFANAYRASGPEGEAAHQRASARATCSSSLLTEKTGEITPRWMMRIARDRSSTPSLDLDVTASSCVSILPDLEDSLPVFWWCPSVPSNSCYVPFFVHGSALPDMVSTAGTYGRTIAAPTRARPDRFSEDSYWWRFRELADLARQDYANRTPIIRAEFDALEREFEAGLEEIVAEAFDLRAAGCFDEAADVLDGYSEACVEQASLKVDLLREKFRKEKVAVPPRFKLYVGTYTATLNGEQMHILVQNDHLAVKMPDDRVFELKEPDEDGRWFFVLTDQAAVSFVQEDSGKVTSMKFHQGTSAFELVRAKD